jgi:hypothetical protein
MRPGFHWDVNGRGQISTPHDLWRVEGHVNIEPDAKFRPRGNNVRKLA